MLPSGAAIGFGVGPVLLSAKATLLETLARQSAQSRSPIQIACPGETTTATFLCRTMLPFAVEPVQMCFSEIMPRVRSGEFPLGACIHEGRFTWQDSGLQLVADLGELWETQVKAPLPLGGLVARRNLGRATIGSIADCVRRSIVYAFANRRDTIPTMRRFAQEFSQEVLFQHVDLYVNQWTLDLGDMGNRALAAMHKLAHQRGMINNRGLEIFPDALLPATSSL